jgi:1-acyl-sn-glycerol-3-phosphate acyltransferase
MIIKIFIWWFRLKGWKVQNNIPNNIAKAVVIGAPHTSNWDFVYTMAYMHIVQLKTNYFIKKELYTWPLKSLLKQTGAIPIARNSNTNLVAQMVQELKDRNELKLLLSAEGTRKKVSHWKSGFYQIALQAKVPIILGYLDYSTKTAGLGLLLYLTGNKEADMQAIQQFYSNKVGKNPQNFDIDSVKLK